MEHVEDIVSLAANAFGITIKGSFDTRSVGRIVLEGGVASLVQGAEYVTSCEGMGFQHQKYAWTT